MSDSTPFTVHNLNETEDAAAKHGRGEVGEVRFPAADLGATDTGFAHHRIRPGVRQPFGHRHERAEEIYLVLSGSGRAKLDEEIVELGPLDALRVSPPVTRAFEAGPEGMELLCFGPRHQGDGAIEPGWWAD